MCKVGHARARPAAAIAPLRIPRRARTLKSRHLDAAKVVDGTVRKGNEANEVAMNGLDCGRRVSAWDYSALADSLAQLLGWQGDAFKKLVAAMECVDKPR